MARVGLALAACLLLVAGGMYHSSQPSGGYQDELLSRRVVPAGEIAQMRRTMQLVARGRAIERKRLAMLAEEESAAEEGAEGEAPCVSWRGCSHVYNNQTMNTTQSYYDRYDRFPNAWDASPSAQWFRAQYPGGNFPAYPDQETVIVGGDPMADYPVQQYGAPMGGTLQPYGPNTYYY